MSLWALLLLMAAPVLHMACATDGGARRGDYDDDDFDRPRRRRRRRRKPPNLIFKSAKRLPDAVIQRSRRGRPRNDIATLRSTFCDGQTGADVIFYQLVVAREWHYYWLCSSMKVRKAATARGGRLIKAWIKRIKHRARVDAADCMSGSTRRLFKVRHRSGVIVKAYCDGILKFRYPGGGVRTVPFRFGAAGGARVVGGDGGATRYNDNGATRKCPTCPTCPTASGTTCPPCRQRTCPTCPICRQRTCPTCPKPRPCPKPKPCPPPNTKATCKTFGEKAFWLGVKQACRRICPSIYKKCHKINPNTAMCHMLQEYCEALRGVCKR